MQSCAGSLTNAIVLAMNLDEFGSSGDGPDRRNDRNWKNSEMNLVNRTIIMNKEEATAIEGVAEEEKEGEQVLDLPQKTKDKD